MATSLYIHIPFCAVKCNYCSFNSYSGLESLQERYIDALAIEMAIVAEAGHLRPLETVFLGGGTPSLLSCELLERLFNSLRSCFELRRGAEISIEINPGTVDRKKLAVMQRAGVNRLSFGVQSFNDRELRGIGRIHTAAEARAAVEMARREGFSNVSLDLMYGLPGQGPESWKNSLEEAILLELSHLSLYQLTVEEQTPLQRMITDGERAVPREELIAEMDEITSGLTGSAGLRRYEISNYSQAGSECRHNRVYWQNDSYFGCGAGAVSYIGGSRRRNENIPESYCDLVEAGESVVVETEILSRDESLRETVIMGLRMTEGVSVAAVKERFGVDLGEYYGTSLEDLIRKDLLWLTDSSLCLTARGRIFANQVMAELV